MPRFHFNQHNGETHLDDVGTELPDLEAAWREATRYTGELLSGDPKGFRESEELHVAVTDDRGLLLFEIVVLAHKAPGIARFAEAVPLAQSS